MRPRLTISLSSAIAVSLAVLGANVLAACGAAPMSGSPAASLAPPATASSTSSVPSPSPSATFSLPAGWTPYTSATQAVAFDLPPSWRVSCDDIKISSWLLVDAGALYTSCPQGDGQVGVFVESVAGTAPPTGMSLISTGRALYANVQTTTVDVNGLKGTRWSGDQTQGQGSGSSQLEYDVTTGGRTYYVLAIVGGVAGVRTATAAEVDRFVQTFTFGH